MGKAKNLRGDRGWKVVGTSYKGHDPMVMVSLSRPAKVRTKTFSATGGDTKTRNEVTIAFDREQLREFIYALQDEYRLFPEIPGTDACATCGFTKKEHGQPRACKAFVPIDL